MTSLARDRSIPAPNIFAALNNAAFATALALALMLHAAPVMGQELTAGQAAQPVAEKQQPEEGASSATTRTDENTGAATGQDGGIGSATSTNDQADPSTSAGTPETPAGSETATEAAAGTSQTMRSIIKDPAGAISKMLTPHARDPNLPHGLSPWGMFLAADWVVKGVMLGLAFASLVTWTVWLAKSLELAGAKARVTRTVRDIRASKTLNEALGRVGRRRGPAALMLQAAKEEAELSEEAIDLAGGGGLKERVGSALGRIEATAGRRISKGTGVLATIGSTAPFVGLFGTVWGIMNAFIGISEAQTTNLAVVAPGIAEALLATAIGLVAAIPAVVIYNVFARSITGYRHLLADAATGVERLVSRDLDFRKVPARADVSTTATPSRAAE
jgi:biopolymer transport protein ExbB